MTSTERYVVSPRAPFLAATVAIGLVVVAMIALAVLAGGLGALLCLAVAVAAAVIVIARLRARVVVTPEQVEISTGFGSTVVPRRPVPEVAVVKQSLGWTPVLRVTGGADVPVLPLAGWSQTGAAKAAAELSAALDRIRRK
ncbi:MAG: hypothetical protein U0R68_08240 [Candidatus Nanopelagicales bacterium]